MRSSSYSSINPRLAEEETGSSSLDDCSLSSEESSAISEEFTLIVLRMVTGGAVLKLPLKTHSCPTTSGD